MLSVLAFTTPFGQDEASAPFTNFKSLLPSDDETIEDAKLGEIQISIVYSPATSELVVKVKRARRLYKRGFAIDPFVKVSLFPDPTKKYSYKTEVKAKTADPVFDETMTFPKVSESDLGRKVLKLGVYNEFEPINPYIGEVNIKLSKVGSSLALPTWVPLRMELEEEFEDTDDRDDHPRPQVPPMTSAASTSSLTAGLPAGAKRQDTDAHSVAPSMVSAMSAVSMAAAVKVHEYGKVHLSVQYKYSKQTLQVVVIAARLNKAPGSSGIPNPYVKLYLVPDPTKKSKQKSKAQKSTLDPVFNETFEFKLDNKDIVEKRLQVSIWDHENMAKNTFFGEALVRLSTLPPNEVINKWFNLESLSHGEILCQLSYDQISDYLSVTVVKARDLMTSKGNTPDPYVKIYLLPDRKKQTKRKTHFLKQTVNPEYNETIKYFMAELDNPRGRMLHVSVLDHGSINNSELIGSFSVPVNDIIEAGKIDQWYSLIRDKMSMSPDS